MQRRILIRARLFVSVVLLIGFATRSMVRADEIPTFAEIEAHIVSARGAAPPAMRETIETTANGLHNRFVSIRDGANERSDGFRGPLHNASGRFEGQLWRQNDNGQTILVQPDPNLVAPERDVDSVTRISSPVAGFMLSSLDVSGFGTRRYVDEATWRVVRRDDVRGYGTTVTTYDDFRTTGTYAQAFHWTRRDGHPDNDSDSHIVAFDAGPVAHDDLAIPPARRALVEFPTGKTMVSLPVRVARGKFIVRVTIAGRGLDFFIDSGAAGISIEDSVATQLGIKPFAPYSNGANAGVVRERSAVVPQMAIGDLTMHDVVVNTLPSEITDSGDYKIVGLLGFDFIADIALKLDYEHETATAYDSSSFVEPAGSGIILDTRIGSGVPLVSATVEGAVGERFMIDTGAAGGLMLFRRYVDRNSSVLQGKHGRIPSDVRMHGVGGDIPIEAYTFDSVRVGSVNFQDFVAYVVTNKNAYAFGDDGVIGTTFLQIFDVYFDYSNSKVYLMFNDLGKRARRPVTAKP